MTEESPLVSGVATLANENPDREFAKRRASQVDAIPANVGREIELAAVAQGIAIPNDELCEQLRLAVVASASRDAESMHTLHAAVTNFTVALRNAGTSAERVLIAIKTVINNRTLVVIAPHTSDWRGDTLRETISTWSIEEFYKEQSA